jgi:hypothetical protein
MKEKVRDQERFFSIELESKANLKNLNLTNGFKDSALVEGTIGSLVNAGFAENEILEIVGKKGTLRINLNPNELNFSPQGSAAEKQAAAQEIKTGR